MRLQKMRRACMCQGIRPVNIHRVVSSACFKLYGHVWWPDIGHCIGNMYSIQAFDQGCTVSAVSVIACQLRGILMNARMVVSSRHPMC